MSGPVGHRLIQPTSTIRVPKSSHGLNGPWHSYGRLTFYTPQPVPLTLRSPGGGRQPQIRPRVCFEPLRKPDRPGRLLQIQVRQKLRSGGIPLYRRNPVSPSKTWGFLPDLNCPNHRSGRASANMINGMVMGLGRILVTFQRVGGVRAEDRSLRGVVTGRSERQRTTDRVFQTGLR